MSILTLLFLIIIGLATVAGISLFNPSNLNSDKAKYLLRMIWSVALFTLTFGILSQILGLINVFSYLENENAKIASSVLAKGIKLTFHPTLYGLLIYLVSILIALGLHIQVKRVETQ